MQNNKDLDRSTALMEELAGEEMRDHVNLGLSPVTNLIEQAAYHYSLQERETPNQEF